MMLTDLPIFPYCADPIRDERIIQQDILCEVCNLPRGWSYVGGIYAINRPTQLCPWCVSDSRAAIKYAGHFQDVHFSESASAESVAAVMAATPRILIWNPIQLFKEL